MITNPFQSSSKTPTSLSSKTGAFPSPFLDIASFMLPSSMKEVLDLCTMFWLKHGTYRSASQRIVRYFITEPEFTQSENNRVELTDFLKKDFNVSRHAASVGDDLLSCGMTASSMIFPFNRFLSCPKCHTERFIDNISWKFSNKGFNAKCPNCSYSGAMKVVDRKCFDRERVFMQRWNPYDIFVQQHPYSKRTTIQWDIPVDIRNRVKAGDEFMIRDMPLEILQTIQDNRVFEFSPQFVLYEAEDTLASVDLKGYGLPRLMANFAQAYYVQMIKSANESLAKDYMVPFRLLSPSALPIDSQSPWTGSVNSELVNQSVSAMVERHRHDPTSWNFSPVPMNYSAFSGEGQMASPELLEQGINELLCATGLPVELYKGSIAIQAAPMALRILQQSWPTMISFLNKWLEFVVWNTTRYMNWETPESIHFKPVTLADDIERRQLLLQLASANMVSKKTAFGVWGLDPSEEQEQIINEMRSEQDSQREFAEDMQKQEENQALLSQQGAMPGGMVGAPGMASGAMGAGVPGMPYDIQTVSGKAQQIEQTAQQLVSMPYEARRSEMLNIKKSDPELHALVKAKMEEIRSAARSQGSAQLAQGGM